MTRQPKSHPCLPERLLEEFKTDPVISSVVSVIQNTDFEELRVKLVSGDVSAPTQLSTPDKPCDDLAAQCRLLSEYKSSPWMQFDPNRNRTWLHVAVEHNDIPLVYELIRLGVAIDVQDSDGLDALQLSVEYLRSFTRIQASYRTLRHSSAALDTVKRNIESQERVATILIEQHADVNLGRRGETPISVAIQACRWSVVDLLLRHGASPPPFRRLRFKSTSDERHYLCLVSKYKSNTPRPPRPCPCWSGQLLSECHAAGPLPYPDNFICKCGSRKVYAKCCSKRDFKIEERWNESRNCIVARSIGTILLPKPDLKNPDTYAEQIRVLNKSMGFMGMLCKDPESYRKLSAKMYERRSMWIMRGFGSRADTDPAYLYACLKAPFFPRPWGKHLSKIECREYSEKWNKFVDEYISLGCDGRSRFDIERAAKIGLHGGPLYRRCEEPSCEKVEGREVEKMKCCGRCKLAFYCSPLCQTNNWPDHKAACKSLTHKEQQLPSQEIFEEVIMTSAARAKTENLDVKTLLAMFSIS